jgi:ABC-type glycerol-3-phosphate transport system permease component
VFVMRNTFLQIPWELSEVAAVDGASPARRPGQLRLPGRGRGHRDDPVRGLYLDLQRFYVRGLMAGVVKG